MSKRLREENKSISSIAYKVLKNDGLDSCGDGRPLQHRGEEDKSAMK